MTIACFLCAKWLVDSNKAREVFCDKSWQFLDNGDNGVSDRYFQQGRKLRSSLNHFIEKAVPALNVLNQRFLWFFAMSGFFVVFRLQILRTGAWMTAGKINRLMPHDFLWRFCLTHVTMQVTLKMWLNRLRTKGLKSFTAQGLYPAFSPYMPND